MLFQKWLIKYLQIKIKEICNYSTVKISNSLKLVKTFWYILQLSISY